MNNKLGILHVKCIAADGEFLFLSSANLTEYAFTINMELGVLINAGDLPAAVKEHFEKLIERGVLKSVGRGFLVVERSKVGPGQKLPSTH